jgi:hypothetical protein
MDLSLQIISRNKIDINRYDRLVKQSGVNGLYTEVWYLDLCCNKQWSLLLLGDYQGTIVLPTSKKILFNLIQHPILFQQSFVLTQPGVVIDYAEIIQFLSKSFSYISLRTSERMSKESEEKINCILKSEDYLSSKVSSTLRSNLKKSKKFELRYQESEDINLFFQFFKNHYHLTGSSIPENQVQQFEKIIKGCYNNKKTVLSFAYSKKGELVSVICWVIHNSKAYYMAAISSEEGRKQGAAHYLVDEFIRKNRQISKIDFEGSSIEGVRRFYKTFGAQEIPYYHFHKNNLPFPLNKLKK